MSLNHLDKRRLPPLEPAAQAVLSNVQAELDVWIGERVKEISDATVKRLEERASELDSEMSSILKEDRASAEALKQRLQRIQSLATTITSNNTQALSELATELNETQAQVMNDLAERENKYRSFGKKAVEYGSSVVKSIL